MSGAGNLGYDEKTLDAAATPEGHARSVRYYDNARRRRQAWPTSDGPAGAAARAAADRRGHRRRARSTLFSPRGTLTSDELDLIDISGNTLLLDHFLPAKPVAVGEKWRPAEKLLGMILQLDEVRRSDVRVRAQGGDARPWPGSSFRAACRASVHGVPCQLEIKAKCRFDRKTNRIDWFAMLIDDKREVSDVEQGLDVVARLEIKISPKSESYGTRRRRALAGLPLTPAAELCRLLCQPPDGDWQLTHDRCWFLVDSAAIWRRCA